VTWMEWFRIQGKDVIHALTKECGECRNTPHFFPAMASGHGK
jgi:hypothetical protein